MREDTGAYVIFDIEGVIYNIDPSEKMIRDLPPA